MSENEADGLRRKVAFQLVQLARIETAKGLAEAENEVRHRKRMEIFGHLLKSGPASREVALSAVLTPEEREVAKQMKQKAPAKRGYLPWRHRGASLLR